MNWKLDLVVKRPYEEDDKTLCFQSTSVVKVVILTLVTMGFYQYVLMYNYWKTLKNNFGYDVSPFWRAVFNLFTNFKLFPIFGNYIEAFKLKVFSPITLAILYFICSYGSDLLRKITAKMDTPILFSLFIEALFLSSIVILAYFQKKINKINEEHFPDAPKNRWSIANTVWTILGIAVYTMALVVIIMEELQSK